MLARLNDTGSNEETISKIADDIEKLQSVYDKLQSDKKVKTAFDYPRRDK